MLLHSHLYLGDVKLHFVKLCRIINDKNEEYIMEITNRFEDMFVKVIIEEIIKTINNKIISEIITRLFKITTLILVYMNYVYKNRMV